MHLKAPSKILKKDAITLLKVNFVKFFEVKFFDSMQIINFQKLMKTDCVLSFSSLILFRNAKFH